MLTTGWFCSEDRLLYSDTLHELPGRVALLWNSLIELHDELAEPYYELLKAKASSFARIDDCLRLMQSLDHLKGMPADKNMETSNPFVLSNKAASKIYDVCIRKDCQRGEEMCSCVLFCHP